MTKRIFVTATNTDIGKTYTTKLLLKEFASRNLRVGVIKPIETGVKIKAVDGQELLRCVQEVNKEFSNLHVEDIVPITYELPAAPFVASNCKKLNLQKIDKAIEKIEKLCDVLIIEGAGGLYVPIDDEYMIIDLIAYFKASAILVTHCSLGCINDTLLSKKALEDKKIPYVIAFNCREDNDSFSVVSEPYFLKTGFEVLKVDENIDTICDVLYNLQII
ncbi:dethiobiotin synthase [Candidatus Sulfurimonas marisnigri]|uniref:ATP-dependent dethiobiotin synthetase BioD n=1 Tax=Candidatus Sulfurimonas marisnigri TaxID=2740405 RepID=A0A7S7RQ46_9BACT|nr:dethiobiotin synthase [Candidatus Sulfurimonas marisnigri]QOY55062.1 dethiobiotin synthase [Candidatus Sulfurimonas marisnigri]